MVRYLRCTGLLGIGRTSVFRFHSTKRWSSTTESSVGTKPPKSWRVLFFGTDDISLPTLRALYSFPSIVAEVGVVCPPDSRKPSEVKTFADQKGLHYYQPDLLSDWTLPPTKDGQTWDIAVVCSYGHLIPEKLISALPFGGINMHPSNVPFYRGAAPLFRQLESGDTVGGISVIEVHPTKFDRGNVLLQWPFRIPHTIGFASFARACADRGAQAVLEVLANYESYASRKAPQRSTSEPITVVHEPPPLSAMLALEVDTQNLLQYPYLPVGSSIAPEEGLKAASSRPLYARLVKPEEGEVDWRGLTAQQVYCKWRAFADKIGCYSYFHWPANSDQRQRLKFIHFHPPSESAPSVESHHPAGTGWYHKKSRTLHVKCLDRAISCSVLQVSGKNAGEAERFLNGYLHTMPKRVVQFCQPENLPPAE